MTHTTTLEHRIATLARDCYGLENSDLIFDALTFPLSTGDDDLRTSSEALPDDAKGRRRPFAGERRRRAVARQGRQGRRGAQRRSGKAAEAQCANHRRQMTTIARDEATRKRAATQAKSFMCRGMASSRCERQVCMEACLVLEDQACIQQMRYVIDHGPAPKY